MNNLTKAVLMICFVQLLTVPSVNGQKKYIDLSKTKITLQMERQPLGLVIRQLIEIYDVPIGFEQSMLDSGHNDYDFETNVPSIGERTVVNRNGEVRLKLQSQEKFGAKSHLISIHAHEEPLENVLDTIVGQIEHYKWEINDGVVNIFPIRGRDPRFVKLLRLRIAKFTLVKGGSVRMITTAIIDLPEFKRFLSETNLHFTGMRSGSNMIVSAQYDRIINAEMEFSDLTFRDLLNRATRMKRGGWIIKKKRNAPSNEEHIDIDI